MKNYKTNLDTLGGQEISRKLLNEDWQKGQIRFKFLSSSDVDYNLDIRNQANGILILLYDTQRRLLAKKRYELNRVEITKYEETDCSLKLQFHSEEEDLAVSIDKDGEVEFECRINDHFEHFAFNMFEIPYLRTSDSQTHK